MSPPDTLLTERFLTRSASRFSGDRGAWRPDAHRALPVIGDRYLLLYLPCIFSIGLPSPKVNYQSVGEVQFVGRKVVKGKPVALP
jgi:hypothetical protein